MKKTLLFNISLSDLYVNDEKAILKIKKVFQTFATSELRILWVLDYHFEEQLLSIENDTFYNEYLELKQWFMDNIDGDVVLYENLNEAVANADAYYGSAGFVMGQCIEKSIPVMKSNIEILN